jgi:lipid II:glycine glycyltransferase (peptidoglycan interpeptide bridge formation enzyme)
LDLTGGESAVFNRFESSTRRAIRRGEQGDLNIEFSRDIEPVRAFYRLMCVTRRRHGVPPQPFSFFACIQRHVLAKDQGWIVLARHNGIPVAGAVYLHFGNTVTYKYGASDENFQHLRANNAVMWEAIKRHVADGFTTLDFGRTAVDNEGLRKFKLGWGTIEHPIDYVRQDLCTDRYATAKPSSSGRLARVFQSLPDPIFRLVGEILYKHVA